MKTDSLGADKEIHYDRARDAYQVQVPPDESLSMAVPHLVGTVLDRDPVDLPPLHGRIDTDALSSLFPAQPQETGENHGVVEFTYAGCRVNVYAHREVVVEPEHDDVRDRQTSGSGDRPTR